MANQDNATGCFPHWPSPAYGAASPSHRTVLSRFDARGRPPSAHPTVQAHTPPTQQTTDPHTLGAPTPAGALWSGRRPHLPERGAVHRAGGVAGGLLRLHAPHAGVHPQGGRRRGVQRWVRGCGCWHSGGATGVRVHVHTGSGVKDAGKGVGLGMPKALPGYAYLLNVQKRYPPSPLFACMQTPSCRLACRPAPRPHRSRPPCSPEVGLCRHPVHKPYRRMLPPCASFLPSPQASAALPRQVDSVLHERPWLTDAF